MAIVHFINSKSKQTAKGMKYVLGYTTQDSKTIDDNGVKLVTGVNCNVDSACTEFCNTKNLFGKTDGRQYYHFVQSFGVDENISPQTAHEIALRFASETEKFHGFEIVVSTHCDRDHIHSHFVMNSVNSENGKKFHITENEIDELMLRSDKLCMEYGLSIVTDTSHKIKSKNMSDREYRSAYKGESWKLTLEATIANAMKIAKSKEHFIMLMEFEGYKVNWTDTRKYITYTTPQGNKCRDAKLYDNKFLKECMENEFKYREKITQRVTLTGTREPEGSRNLRTVRNGYGTKLESVDDSASYTAKEFRRDIGQAQRAHDKREGGSDYENMGRIADKQERRSGPDYPEVQDRLERAGGTDAEECFEFTHRCSETGWEDERRFFESSLSGEEISSQAYSEAYADSSDTIAYSHNLGTDTAFLLGNISQIIDEDYQVDDCTTQPIIVERKDKDKYHGLVMGGM